MTGEQILERHGKNMALLALKKPLEHTHLCAESRALVKLAIAAQEREINVDQQFNAVWEAIADARKRVGKYSAKKRAKLAKRALK